MMNTYWLVGKCDSSDDTSINQSARQSLSDDGHDDGDESDVTLDDNVFTHVGDTYNGCGKESVADSGISVEKGLGEEDSAYTYRSTAETTTDSDNNETMAKIKIKRGANKIHASLFNNMHDNIQNSNTELEEMLFCKSYSPCSLNQQMPRSKRDHTGINTNKSEERTKSREDKSLRFQYA